MNKVSKIYDGTDPGATPGRVFTASIGQETIVQEGKFLDYLMFGLKGAVSTAAVAIEDFAGVLSEYTLRVGADTRILLNLRQMVALMAFYYGELPFIWENTDNTGNDFIGGVKLPLNLAVDANKPINHAATKTAVANVGTETLGISGYFSDAGNGKKPIHAVAISKTTAAATGYDLADVTLPPIGKLKGVILQHANTFADGNIDISVQRLRLLVNGQISSQFNSLTDSEGIPGIFNGVEDPITDMLKVFSFFRLPGDGIDLKANEVKFQLDVEDASDAVAIIPVIEIE
ncbi:MAG TPA: hypothetical protein P5056_02885 [Candidatus Paceibacterota bacterium]|nr:hypothetical protein [Candidatus Paceibacterota bacterium]